MRKTCMLQAMRVCVLTPVLDAFKGGNHLPLFAALPDIQWTILTHHTKPLQPSLPANVSVQTLGGRLGPYYYGIADHRFASAVMRAYPPVHSFWKQFDVLHLNQTMGLPLLRLRETGRPVLYFIHHPVSADREIVLQETSRFEALRWRLKYLFLRRWQRMLFRSLPHVATVSQTVSRRLVSDYGEPREPVAIVPNGVDGSAFQPEPGFGSDFDVIAVGSLLHPRKGFPYLLRAYRELSRRGYRIADVGKRSDEQRGSMAELAGVRVFGTVDDDQLRSLVRRSRVLLSTSLYEGFGLSLIEALACGRPAFAFDAGATGEVLRPIDEQLVSPARDVSLLVDRIVSFLELPAGQQEALGRSYRTSVLERYPLHVTASALRALYGRLTVVHPRDVR